MKNDIINRILEIVPGIFIWLLITIPLWGGLTLPSIIINLIVILAVYWLYRAMVTMIFMFVGLYYYKRDIKVDWLEKCKNLDFSSLPEPETLPKTTQLPYHLIVIANYGEEYEIIKRSIDSIINQNYPLENIFITVSIEERKAKKDTEYAQRGEKLKMDFGDLLGERLFFSIHPENIPNEAVGAASNRTWGTKKSVERLEKMGYNIEEFLITAPDGDLVFDRNYFAALTYKWLVSEKRNNKFYQTGVYTFNNNYWDVPILIRSLMINLTLPVLASSIFEKYKRETWSCFTLNLKLMKDVDYWDTTIHVGADDTTFFWRPYFYLNGDWTCEVFFVSLSADAVYHPNYFINHIDQYKQYQRWGWGVITFPLAIRGLLLHSRISFIEKVRKIIHLLEVFVFWKVFAFLVILGIPIIFLVNPQISEYTIGYYAANTVSVLLTIAYLAIIPAVYVKLNLIPPKPQKMSKIKFWFLIIIETPLNVINLFTYSFIPFVDATTRMMLGQARKSKVVWSEKRLKSKSN